MTRLFGVAGSPVFQSKSPFMFNAAFRDLGIDAIYVRLAASSAKEVMATAHDVGLQGFNVTSPFKTEIMDYLDDAEDDARKIGAVNTVVRKGGRFVGYNTDVEGVRGAVASHGLNLMRTKAVVLGAGGAARAAALALRSAGARVVIVNRTHDKARDAAERLECEALPFGQLADAMADASLLVAAVSSHERIVDPSLLARRLVVLDANYGRPSALVEDVARLGCGAMDGREWLLAQAIPAFTLFTGRRAPENVMRRALWKRRMDARSSLALIGFMGSGKSVVAEELAALAGMPVVDIDKKIEEKAGMPIAEIFHRNGEEVFRRMEQAEIDELRNVARHVVSCGGGAVLARPNVRVLRNNCLSVWLWANAALCLDRIGSTETRPLLSGSDPESSARDLLRSRIPYYAATCDFVVSTEGKTPAEIARRIWHEVHHAFAS